MNHDFPVYTIENTCQDCCKCVRHCPCKAIRVVDGRAAVIPELCVSCGRCVRVCPAGAKKIRPDLSRGRFLLTRKARVYASLAPSFVSYFRDVPTPQLIAALRKLGFAGVSETALGAQIVSAETVRYLESQPDGVYLSGACPAAVAYFCKYAPEYARRIVPIQSPLMAHAKLLRKTYGDDIGVVFFGPCAAKKLEADRNSEVLDLALTFGDLAEWLKQEKIDPWQLDPQGQTFVPENAAEGRVYSLEGGMNDTLRRDDAPDRTRYLAISGLLNIQRVLTNDRGAADRRDCKLFIECLACSGGCINGPAMPESDSTLSGILETARDYDGANSRQREVAVNIAETIRPEAPNQPEISDADIKQALAQVGKHSRADELNCGGCGYFTCRAFARAMVEGKAEKAMCLSYLRQLAQKKSNALIRYIPAGVVIADRNLNIIECNRHFAELFDESTRLAYDATPGLAGVALGRIIDFDDLFAAALASGGEILQPHYASGDKILHLSIFTIEPHQIVGAIAQDVTSTELQREHISERAREVIRKNVFTVQKIAHYLGEHMAETEILLREVAGNYSGNDNPEKKP